MISSELTECRRYNTQQHTDFHGQGSVQTDQNSEPLSHCPHILLKDSAIHRGVYTYLGSVKEAIMILGLNKV